MTSTEVLDLAAQFEKATGKSSDDWDALIDWLKTTKGEEVAAAFVERCGSGPL